MNFEFFFEKLCFSLESKVHFTLTAYLNSDEPDFKCSTAHTWLLAIATHSLELEVKENKDKRRSRNQRD